MEFELSLVIYICVVQFIAFLIKGLVGFGNPLISQPLLAMQLDNAIITPGNALMDTPVNGYIAWKNRKNLNFRSILPILIAVVLGIIPGAIILKFGAPWVLKILLGILILIIGIEMATRGTRPLRKENQVVKLLVAFISGVCSGLFGINMLIIAYIERTAKDHSEFKGSLCLLFVFDNVIRMISYIVIGTVGREAIMLFLVSVPAAALGIIVSNIIEPYLPQKALKKSVIAMFLLSGMSIIVKALIYQS